MQKMAETMARLQSEKDELMQTMIRRQADRPPAEVVSSADPLNLAGIIMPGPRVSRFAVAG